jgi:hypothetical protein
LLVARHRALAGVYATTVDANIACRADDTGTRVLDTSASNTELVGLARHVVTGIRLRNTRKITLLTGWTLAVTSGNLRALAVVGIAKLSRFAINIVAQFVKTARDAGTVNARLHRWANNTRALVYRLYATRSAGFVCAACEFWIRRTLIGLTTARQALLTIRTQFRGAALSFWLWRHHTGIGKIDDKGISISRISVGVRPSFGRTISIAVGIANATVRIPKTVASFVTGANNRRPYEQDNNRQHAAHGTGKELFRQVH